MKIPLLSTSAKQIDVLHIRTRKGNVEVFQKGKFCKYLDEAKIYDQLSDKERESMKDKISAANWEIMSKIDEAKKRSKRCSTSSLGDDST